MDLTRLSQKAGHLQAGEVGGILGERGRMNGLKRFAASTATAAVITVRSAMQGTTKAAGWDCLPLGNRAFPRRTTKRARDNTLSTRVTVQRGSRIGGIDPNRTLRTSAPRQAGWGDIVILEG